MNETQDAATARPKTTRGRWKRRLAWTGGVLAGVLAILVAGDLVYCWWVGASYNKWNAAVPRDTDGVREGCREFTLGRGETAILMVHGFASSPNVWRKMAGELSARGYACRAMRLPGFAMPMEDYRRTSLARWREAFAAELAELKASHERVFVLGHSMGAALAVDRALDHPGEVRALVLLAPMFDIANRMPLFSTETWYRVIGALLNFTDVIELPFEPDARDPDARAALKNDRHVPESVFDGVAALVRRLRVEGSDLRTPVFVAISVNDIVVDSGAAERFFASVRAEPKRLVRMERPGHALPVDYDWRELTERVAGFIRELESSGD